MIQPDPIITIIKGIDNWLSIILKAIGLSIILWIYCSMSYDIIANNEGNDRMDWPIRLFCFWVTFWGGFFISKFIR